MAALSGSKRGGRHLPAAGSRAALCPEEATDLGQHYGGQMHGLRVLEAQLTA